MHFSTHYNFQIAGYECGIPRPRNMHKVTRNLWYKCEKDICRVLLKHHRILKIATTN